MNEKETKRLQLIKEKYCKNFTVQETEHFLYVSEKLKLDPLMRQIYAIKMGGELSIQTSIDGFRLLAERTGKYSPGEDVHYEYTNEEKTQLLYASATVKKRTDDGTWHNITGRAYWKEYAKPNARFWKQLPHAMLAKCAEAVALRRAFPDALSGLYIQEEIKNGDYISEDEVAEIKKLLAPLSNGKYDALLQILKIKDMAEVPAGAYEKTFNFIKNYVNKHTGEKK